MYWYRSWDNDLVEPFVIEEVAHDDYGHPGSNIGASQFVCHPPPDLVSCLMSMPPPAFKNQAGGGYQPLVVEYNHSAHAPARSFYKNIINVNDFCLVFQGHAHCSHHWTRDQTT